MNAAEFAQNEGFKVVLSGNGADELFAGYRHSLKLKKWLYVKKFNFLRNFIFTKDNFSNKVKNYLSQDDVFDFFRQSQVAMKPSEAKDIFSREIFSKINPDLHSYHVNEKKSYRDLFLYDMKYSLSSHHVFRDDLSAMKFGVEFRYPYLSNALIDFVATLPEEIVFNGIQNKPLLRKVAKDFLPEEVMNMPKKGFSFPLAHFIRTKKEMRDFVSEHLTSLAKRNFFNKNIIENWWENCSEDHDYIKIWQLVTFEIWYRKYFENT
jgi:asparagine synthase (glutamine-hydrolysing)